MAAQYPLPKFHFLVEWGGTRIGFTEVSGLTAEVDIIEYREGSSPEYHKTKQPGLSKYANLSLKRGTFEGDNQYFEWFNTIKLNTVERRDVTISLLNEEHQPVVVWKIRNAFPIKVQSTDLKSDGNEVAIEQLDIAHEGLVIEHP